MMDYLLQYAFFLLKGLTLLLLFVLAVGALVAASRRGKGKKHDSSVNIEVTKLNEEFDEVRKKMETALSEGDQGAKKSKPQRRRRRRRRLAHWFGRKAGAEEKKEESRPRLYVLDFTGDLSASASEGLAWEITAILMAASDGDEVLICIESGGGSVEGYGLAAAQLDRIKARGLKLMACIDRVAASGGYMMASVADHIMAAPFAIVGSIGVVTQLPNFHRLLKKHDVDYEIISGGRHKRTLTMFGENTEEGRAKLTEQIEGIHEIFRRHVAGNRDGIDIEAVSTGEPWLGQQALDNKLVDELKTSDDYLLEVSKSRDIYCVRYQYGVRNWWTWLRRLFTLTGASFRA